MLSLNTLPPAILGFILQDSALSVSLWRCGNSALNMNLTSAVEDLPLSHIPLKEFELPQMVTVLRRLRSLRIYCTSDLMTKHTGWTRLLKRLPRSLEALTIDSTDSDQVFINFDNAVVIVDSDYYQLAQEPHYNMVVLPNLRSLALKRSARSLGKSFLLALPPTLTSLTLENDPFALPFMSQLPRDLQRLEANAKMTGARKEEFDDLALTPSGLIIKFLTITHLEEALPLKLPPGLLGVELLNLINCPPPFIAQLPRSVTSLYLSSVNDITWKQFAASTPTKSLNEGAEDQNSLIGSLWPPGLSSLEIRLRSCESGDLSILPRTLTHLRLRLTGRSPYFHCNELPQNLHGLMFSANPIKFRGHFPASITHIICNRPTDAESFSAALPSTLAKLTVCGKSSEGSAVGCSDAYRFPEALTSLTITSVWLIERFDELPRSLTFLEIGNLNMQHESNRTVLVDLWSQLPSTLTSLTVTSADYRVDDENTFLLAPFPGAHLSSLTHLRLPLKSFSMSDRSLEQLPRSMTSLHVTISRLSTLDGSFLAFLPPNLESSALGHEVYTLVDLCDYWPPTAWQSLINTSAKHHIPKLHQRIEISRSAHPTALPSLSTWFESLFK